MENQTTMTQTTLIERHKRYEVKRLAFAEHYASVKGFVDDRPVMPADLCLKLVQGLIDDGIRKDAHIAVIDSTPVLMLHLHEAGFTNLTLLNTSPVKTLREKDRDWLSTIERLCEKNGVRVTDFMTETSRFDVIIGNPPYGNGANLAVKFLNKALELCEDVRFVLPRSFRKPAITNRVNLDFSCIYDETLPFETFVPATSNTKTCYQIWKRQPREKIKLDASHPDWIDLKWEQRDEASLMIRVAGTRAGAMFTAEEMKKYKCGAGHNHFIKASAEVVQRLLSLQDELIELGKEANNQACVGRYQIVALYNQRFN
jgi:hypothetical protein